MDTITLLQHYWWLVISLLGALLVFLMFVQGGQALLYTIGRTEEERNMLVNSLGRKWEFTFTTLVTFGGAFFASFPLFYSTSFGGAFYVWMAILLCFVIQAVAYEYRRKPGNVFGERTFNAFLLVNGVLGPLLIGTAVGTFFTGAEFTVDRLNLANQGGAAVISQWATPWHGLEAVAEWRNVLLGLSVTLLAMTLACQYFMNNIDDEAIFRRAARRMRTFAVLFVACFVAWLLALVLADGWAVDAAGTVSIEPYKYLHNLVEMPYVAAALLIGGVSVLWSVWLGWRGSRRAVRGRRHGAHGAVAAAARGVERHGLLPFARGHAVVADDPQLLVEPLHAPHDGVGVAVRAVRGSLHLVRLACDEPPSDHPRGDPRRRPPVLRRTLRLSEGADRLRAMPGRGCANMRTCEHRRTPPVRMFVCSPG